MKRSSKLATVQRADNGQYSRQPRFSQDERGGLFANLMTFIKRTTEQLEIPNYLPNSMHRDQWLQSHWMLEPHWGGVVNQTVLVDSSRAWSFTGGRNQVKRFSKMLHDADGGKGWRNFFRRQSLSYRTTDMCALTELGRDGADGPLRAVYHVDSARCRWTGDIDEPLEYNPASGQAQRWTESDFFNVASMPSPRERYNGLGYCQTSRAWDLLRLFYAVLTHDQELVGARMPKGIMFLHNVTESQWDTMIAGRDAQLDGKNALYFGGLMIIASMGDETPDGKLVALSQLPANFDRATFIDQTMYGYALVSGYDPTEFWPVSSGALGRGRETDIQHRKASGKGALEFPQGWQDRFQQELPPALLFQFEERDAEGELLDAEVAQAWTNVATDLYTAGLPVVPGLLDQQAALKFLADNSRILDPEDVAIMSEAVATDEETTEMTERALMSPHVRRAIERYPSEPIVRYTWPAGAERMLWERGDDALKPRVWAKPELLRGGTSAHQDELEVQATLKAFQREVDFYRQMRQRGWSHRRAFDAALEMIARQADGMLYESPDGDVVITSGDVDRAVADWDRTMPDDAVGLLEAESIN